MLTLSRLQRVHAPDTRPLGTFCSFFVRLFGGVSSRSRSHITMPCGEREGGGGGCRGCLPKPVEGIMGDATRECDDGTLNRCIFICAAGYSEESKRNGVLVEACCEPDVGWWG